MRERIRLVSLLIFAFVFKKIIQIKEQQRVEILEGENLRQQYDARLVQELQQIRMQNEQDVQLLREDIALQYEKKVVNRISIND